MPRLINENLNVNNNDLRSPRFLSDQVGATKIGGKTGVSAYKPPPRVTARPTGLYQPPTGNYLPSTLFFFGTGSDLPGNYGLGFDFSDWLGSRCGSCSDPDTDFFGSGNNSSNLAISNFCKNFAQIIAFSAYFL